MIGESARLAGTRHRADGLALAEKASAAARELAASDPASHDPLLAAALLNLAHRKIDVASHRKGRSETQLAVELYRRLAASDPVTYDGPLADAGDLLSIQLTVNGRGREGLTVMQEAVRIRQARYRREGTRQCLAELLVSLLWLRARMIGTSQWAGFETAQAQIKRYCRELAGVAGTASDAQAATRLAAQAVQARAADLPVQAQAAAEGVLDLLDHLGDPAGVDDREQIAAAMTAAAEVLADRALPGHALRAAALAVEYHQALTPNPGERGRADLATALRSYADRLVLDQQRAKAWSMRRRARRLEAE